MQCIDRLFAAWDNNTSPGCALGVIRDGQILCARGYGVRDLHDSLPNDADTRFDIASLAKQFTGAAVALLIQRECLSLQDDIRKYVPELPDYGHPVRIHHLLHHTSGIGEYYDGMLAAGWMTKPCTMQDVLRFVTGRHQLDFAPGERFQYSNTGYVLLALTVERAASTAFSAFVADHIFAPLGMGHSVVYDRPYMPIPNMATGHAHDPQQGYTQKHYPAHAVPGSGCLYSTVNDLALWAANFDCPSLGGSHLIDMMLSPGLLNDGSHVAYGFGFDWGQYVQPYKGHRLIAHTGGHAGSISVMAWFPDQRLTIVLLCNSRNVPNIDLVFRVADAFLSHSEEQS